MSNPAGSEEKVSTQHEPIADRIADAVEDVEGAITALYRMYERITDGNMPHDSAKVAEPKPPYILAEVLNKTPDRLHQSARRINELEQMMSSMLL